MRVFVTLLTIVFCFWLSDLCADEPPRRSAGEEQRKLKADWEEAMKSGGRAYSRGDFAEAERSYRAALELARRLYPMTEHQYVAVSLNNLGKMLRDQGKLKDAEPILQEALAIYGRLYPKQDLQEVAANLANVGEVLTDLGKHREAEACFREAVAMYRRIHRQSPHRDLAASVEWLGNSLEAQRKFKEAEQHLRESLGMWRALYPDADHPRLAGGLIGLGRFLYSQGRAAEAEPYMREATGFWRKRPRDVFNLAVCLNDLGLILGDQRKHIEAESSLREALRLWQRLDPKGAHPFQVSAGMNLGVELNRLGRYAEAEERLRSALDARQRLFKNDHRAVAEALDNLGGVLQDQGKMEEAEAVYGKALGMWRRLYPKEDHPDVAVSVHHLGDLFAARGDYAESTRLHRQSLELRRRLFQRDHRDIAASLQGLGVSLLQQGKLVDAGGPLTEAHDMLGRLFKGDHPDVARGLDLLAYLHWASGREEEAERLHLESLKMRRSLHRHGDSPEIASSLNNTAFVLRARRKYNEAEPIYREAQAMYRRMAESAAARGSEGEALNLIATFPGARDGFLSTARARGTDAAEMYKEVWQSKAALSRVYELRHLLARAAATNRQAPDHLTKLVHLRRRRAELILAPEPPDPTLRKKRDDELKSLAADIAESERELPRLLPGATRAELGVKDTPLDLQRALPAGVAFVDFLAFRLFEQDRKTTGRKGEQFTPTYLAFIVTRDRIRGVDLGPSDPIDKAVFEWRKEITDTSRRDSGTAFPAKVRELVWAKLRKGLPDGTNTVYLSPDLGLTRLPWAALPGDQPGTILLDDYAMAVVPHGPFLLDQLTPAGRPPAGTPPGTVLAVGGVGFDEVPARGAAEFHSVPNPPSGPAVKPGRALTWLGLEGSKSEAEFVSRLAAARKLDCLLLTGPDASADRVLTELPKARFALLATHGFFADPSFRSVLQVDSRLFKVRGQERVGAGALSPMVLSGLAFAGANKPDTPGRGLVTGEHLIDRDLSGLELAVLSACETGLGDVAAGEGVFGLQRAFHRAGARNVVASLWKVDDEATAAMMGEFYTFLWDKNLRPIEALRRAQLAVYRAPRTVREDGEAVPRTWQGEL